MCHISLVTCHMYVTWNPFFQTFRAGPLIFWAKNWLGLSVNVLLSTGHNWSSRIKKLCLETFFRLLHLVKSLMWHPGGKKCFFLDLDHIAMIQRLRYMSIILNLSYLLVPCGKTMWVLRLRVRNNLSVPSVNTNILKR